MNRTVLIVVVKDEEVQYPDDRYTWDDSHAAYLRIWTKDSGTTWYIPWTMIRNATVVREF